MLHTGAAAASIVFLLALTPAPAQPANCNPGETHFVLSNREGAFHWAGIRLSLGSARNTGLPGSAWYAGSRNGPMDRRFASLTIEELETASTQDTPSLVRSGIVRLSSNVPAFRQAVPVNFGGFDVADLSFCSGHQVNLHCGHIDHDAGDGALSMRCSLVVFDPADVVTP